MGRIVDQTKPLLENEGIAYYEYEGRIRVPPPNEFGELEIGNLDEDDSIIGLIGSDWHTLGDLLTYYGGGSEPEAICLFVKGIFERKYFLVEQRKAGKVTRKYIQDGRASVVINN
jgi:hypothetical protein